MKLVYIYGPPAAGKYTIASEVARLTDFRLFHNHLAIDTVAPVFEFGTDTFWRLVFQIRETIIGTAAREGVDLLYTSVYGHPDDLPLVNRRIVLVESAGGEVCLVRLTCDIDILETRLQSQSRAAMRKLTDIEAFRTSRLTKDIFSPIPGRPSLTIDTSQLSPNDAAMRIIEHYGLTLSSAANPDY
jgi:hypothetical protein